MDCETSGSTGEGWTSLLRSSRRTFLQAGTFAACGAASLLAGKEFRPVPVEQLRFIFVWLRGGLSPLDSVDPKPHASSKIRGQTTAINTAIPGISFTESFPQLAQRAHQFCLLRGLQPNNDRHGIAEASLLSGTLAETVETSLSSSFGARLAAQFGPVGDVWPNFQIGEELDSRYGGGGTGELPFFTGPIVVPSQAKHSAAHPDDILMPGSVSFRRMLAACGPRPSLARFEQAWRILYDRLQQLDPKVSTASPPVAFDSLVAAAHHWHISSGARRVLDLTSEPASVRARYGETALGDDCLLARRLLEAGARCVTVTSSGWDHHAGIDAEMRKHGPHLDAALSGLLDDLGQRGLLSQTRVVCLTDFGRAPRLNSAGGRDHWPHTGIALLAGAGLPAGSVIGRTDRCGERVLEDSCSATDIGRLMTVGFFPTTISSTRASLTSGLSA